MEILLTLVLGFYLYHLTFFLASLALKREILARPASGDYWINRFAVIVPAHNEARVIASRVANIARVRYPKNLYEVFVVADNCTDETAAEAIRAGATVIERQNEDSRGKQHALAYAFKQIDLDKFDAVVVLDADNTVDNNLLMAFDAHLARGEKVIQGYVETQNHSDSWVTMNYAYIFWYMFRLQMARSKIGLSTWLAGTGLCISTETLRRIGWNVTTLTDDVEYTCQVILAGEKVHLATSAVVYDQKPIGLQDSIKQRVRWVRGQTQVVVKYLPALVRMAFKSWASGDYKAAVRAFDACMWIPMQFILLASFAYALYNQGFIYLLTLCLTAPVMYVLPMVAERIKHRKGWAYLFSAGLFYLTWIPITIYSVATFRKSSWWRTPHTV